MYGLGNNSQKNRDRFANAAITRAQLRTHIAKLRESLRQRYRRRTRRQPWQ
jgi:hypothetical protein